MKIKNKVLAVVVSVFAIFFSIGVLFNIGGPSISNAPIAKVPISETTVLTTDDKEVTNSETNEIIVSEEVTSLSIEDTELTLDEIVENAITAAGADKDSVTINDDLGKGTGKIVLIYLKAKSSLTNSMIKNGMLIEANSILKYLQECDEINEVVIFWSFPLVDIYGNEKEGTILKIDINKETLDKINFDNFTFDKIPEIADDYFEHTALSK